MAACTPENPPVIKNPCNTQIADYYGMDNFCAPDSNIDVRKQYCLKMSSAGEWSAYNGGVGQHNCHYVDSTIPQQVNGPSGNVTCPRGYGLECRRELFTGDPVKCCFNDLGCSSENPNTDPAACYSDAAKQNTCANGSGGDDFPNYRRLVNSDCQKQIFNYCTGNLPSDPPNSTEWLSRWYGGGETGCVYAIKRNLYRDGGTGCSYLEPVPGACNLPILGVDLGDVDLQGYFWSQSLVTAALNKYQQQGFVIGSIGADVGFNPWQDILYDQVCCPYPGLCQQGLKSACAGRTAQRISYNPRAVQWCGCHLPDGEYEKYASEFNVPLECSSICNRIDAIPITGVNGNPILCEQNVCIIDGVTVNLINSQAGGGLNFNQICGNCPAGGCSCIVSNTAIDIINSNIGGNINAISENCGKLTCQQTNPSNIGPNTIPTSCSTGGTNPFVSYETKYAEENQNQKTLSWIWTIIIIIFVLGIIFVLIYFMSRSRNANPSSTKTRQVIQSYDAQVIDIPPTMSTDQILRTYNTPVMDPNVTYINKPIHRSDIPFLK